MRSTSITLYVLANDSDSPRPVASLVDIHWPLHCAKKGTTRVCTVHGKDYTFTAVGTDDDGNQTYATIDINSQISHHDIAVTMRDEYDNLIEATGR